MKSKNSKTLKSSASRNELNNHLERVRQRAYELWETNGCQHGCDTEHWLQAERDVRQLYGESPSAA